MLYPRIHNTNSNNTTVVTTDLGGWAMDLNDVPQANTIICDYADQCRENGWTPYWSVVTTWMESAGINITAKYCI